MRAMLVVLSAVVAVLVAACGQSTPALLPVQTFNFATQPVAFAPPPKPWDAEAQLSGGLRGVRYVKLGSVGEAIGVADYHTLSRRLRNQQIAKLLDMDSSRESSEFDRALREAWAYADQPFSELESEVATAINVALSRVQQARRERDFDTVRSELLAAQAEAGRLHFSLEDVIDRAAFRPETSPNAARYKTLGRRDAVVSGRPAVVLDFTIDLPEGRRWLRKVYLFHNDHLFVAEFIGLETSLPLFDRVVATIAFPS